MLFTKIRDGDRTADFHRLCDYKGKTLMVIETKEGRKLGVFTNDSWDTTDKKKVNYDNFVFSLDSNKKFSNVKNGKSIANEQERASF